MNVQELQAEVAGWIDPLNPNRTSLSTVAKILEEIGELIASERMNDPLELADVAILVLDLFHLQKVDLVKAVQAKLEINRTRTWQIADSGAMRHA